MALNRSFKQGCAVGVILAVAIEGWVVYGAALRSREALWSAASCPSSLKQLGLSFKMYANESEGEVYPSLSSRQGRLFYVLEDLFPEYAPDPRVNVCREDDDLKRRQGQHEHKTLDDYWEIDDVSYFYLGYAVTSDYDMTLFAKAYREFIGTGHPMPENLMFRESDTPLRTYAIPRL